MNVRRAAWGSLGDTWTVRYGSRRGIQQLINGEPVPPVIRETNWSSDMGDAGAGWKTSGTSLKTEQEIDSYWRSKGYSLDKPVKDPIWGALVVRAAYQLAANTAPSKKAYFTTLAQRAAVGYSSASVPNALAAAKAAIGNASPQATSWLVERARRYAVAFEGFSDKAAKKAASTYTVKTFKEESDAPADTSESWTESIPSWAPWAAGATAVAAALLIAFAPSRKGAS